MCYHIHNMSICSYIDIEGPFKIILVKLAELFHQRFMKRQHVMIVLWGSFTARTSSNY